MSYDPEHVSDPDVVTRIRIRTVRGGSNQDKTDLMTCYFEQVGNPGDYGLFETGDDHQIPTAPSLVRSGRDFQFIRGGVLWTVTQFNSDGQFATGNWFNTRIAEEDEGSFQAQAGPTIEGEESVASANA